MKKINSDIQPINNDKPNIVVPEGFELVNENNQWVVKPKQNNMQPQQSIQPNQPNQPQNQNNGYNSNYLHSSAKLLSSNTFNELLNIKNKVFCSSKEIKNFQYLFSNHLIKCCKASTINRFYCLTLEGEKAIVNKLHQLKSFAGKYNEKLKKESYVGNILQWDKKGDNSFFKDGLKYHAVEESDIIIEGCLIRLFELELENNKKSYYWAIFSEEDNYPIVESSYFAFYDTDEEAQEDAAKYFVELKNKKLIASYTFNDPEKDADNYYDEKRKNEEKREQYIQNWKENVGGIEQYSSDLADEYLSTYLTFDLDFVGEDSKEASLLKSIKKEQLQKIIEKIIEKKLQLDIDYEGNNFNILNSDSIFEQVSEDILQMAKNGKIIAEDISTDFSSNLKQVNEKLSFLNEIFSKGVISYETKNFVNKFEQYILLKQYTVENDKAFLDDFNKLNENLKNEALAYFYSNFQNDFSNYIKKNQPSLVDIFNKFVEQWNAYTKNSADKIKKIRK